MHHNQQIIVTSWQIEQKIYQHFVSSEINMKYFFIKKDRTT